MVRTYSGDLLRLMVTQPPLSKSASYGLLAVIIAITCWHSLTVLSSEPVSGWDLLPHLALFENFLEFLRSGHLSGYSLRYDGGVPLFSLYPPLFYLVAAIPHVFSVSAIPAVLSFNLTIFLLPVAFLLACARIGRSYLQESWILAPLFGAIYLLLDARFYPLGIGLGGLHIMGLGANFLAHIFILLLLAELPSLSRSPAARAILAIGGLMGALILTSILMAIFAGWVVLLRLFFAGSRERALLIAGAALGIAISGFWWWPFLQLLPYSSGQAEFGAGERGDLLTAFYPIVSSGLPFFVHSSQLIDRPPFHPFFQDPSISLTGVVIALSSIAGIIALFRQREWFLPVTLIATFVLLEGGFLYEVSKLPLHFYRFAAPLWLIHLLICAYGVKSIGAWLSSSSLKAPRQLPYLVLAVVVGIQAARYCPEAIWGNVAPYMTSKPKLGRFAQSNFRAFPAAQRILRRIQAIPSVERPRIATESSSKSFFELGSPHFFMAAIARETSFEVFPGLLAESSLTSAYVIPTLSGGAARSSLSRDSLRRVMSQIQWGDKELIRQPFFRDLPPHRMLQRLRAFGIRYLVTTTPGARIRLEHCRRCRVSTVERAGPLALFDLRFAAPRCSISDTPPLFYVDAGGIPYKQFAKWFYASGSFGRIQLISHPDGLNVLDRMTTPHPVSGLIVSLDPRKPVTDAQIERWSRYGKVILLNPGRRAFEAGATGQLSVQLLVTASDMIRFDEMLKTAFPRPNRSSSCSVRIEGNEIRVSGSGPATIRYNYSPLVTSSEPQFMTVPPFNFIFARGEAELTVP